jgi:predicted RNA-binding Zn-ribbon protein involved in translation (DUF1610 family)
MDKIGDVAKEVLNGLKVDCSTGEVINPDKDLETCVNCGEKFTWADKQFRRDCPHCGIVVERIDRLGGKQSDARSCGECKNGMISFKYQFGGLLYEVAARCMCPLGQEISVDIPNIMNAPHAPERIRRIFAPKQPTQKAGERETDD